MWTRLSFSVSSTWRHTSLRAYDMSQISLEYVNRDHFQSIERNFWNFTFEWCIDWCRILVHICKLHLVFQYIYALNKVQIRVSCVSSTLSTYHFSTVKIFKVPEQKAVPNRTLCQVRTGWRTVAWDGNFFVQFTSTEVSGRQLELLAWGSCPPLCLGEPCGSDIYCLTDIYI